MLTALAARFHAMHFRAALGQLFVLIVVHSATDGIRETSEMVIREPGTRCVPVTVVVPTRDRTAILSETIDALAVQTADPATFEVIVVDNGTGDDTGRLVREVRGQHPHLRIRWLHERCPGPGAARNRGIRHASGDIILFTDDDCLPEPEWIETMREAFNHDPAVVGVEGLTYTRLTELSPFVHYSANSGGYFPTCNVGYRAKQLRAAGGFDWATFPAANKEDVDLAYRMMWLGRIEFAPFARVFHPARSMSFGWQVHRMRRLVGDELCMMFRWPRELRQYARPAIPDDAELPDGSHERVWSMPNPVRARALVGRRDLLRRRPLLYAKILLLLCVRTGYVSIYLPGSILHAWRHRDPSGLQPLAAPCEIDSRIRSG